MFLQDSVQRSLQNPAEKNPADPHRFAKVKNLGMQNAFMKVAVFATKTPPPNDPKQTKPCSPVCFIGETTADSC